MNLSEGDRVELSGHLSGLGMRCKLHAVVKSVDGDNNITVRCAGALKDITLRPTGAGTYTDGDITVTVTVEQVTKKRTSRSKRVEE